MKILNVFDLMNPALGGGATERSYQMCRYLSSAGHDVDVLTTRWKLDKEYAAKMVRIDCHSVNAIHCRYLLPLGAKKWLREHIGHYDIIHLSGNWSLLVAQAGAMAARQGIPYAFSSMGFVAIHNRSQTLKKFYRRYLTVPLIRKASACIGVTREETNDLIEAGALPEKVHLIPNGIVPEDFSHRDDEHFRRQYGFDGRKMMLFIGRMDPIKGVHILIDAFYRNRERLVDWFLLLVGTRTDYRREMERKVSGLGLQHSVYFGDPIFGKEKSEAYHAAEIVVIPSIKDAMTIIAPEAAYCARPVLITRTSDFSELAQCGAAVEVEPTVDGISRGLDLLTGNTLDRTEMGRKGRDYVTGKFRWDHVVLEYQDLFQVIIESRKSEEFQRMRSRTEAKVGIDGKGL